MPTPQPGEVIFYAACPPPLTAGDYRLEVGQDLRGGGQDIVPAGPFMPIPDEDFAVDDLPPLRRDFSVEGPRFTLNPADIHAVYPPPNSRGNFESRLPQIVLGRRTLPWERTLDGTTRDAGDPPWLALLLFEEGEVTLLDPPACTVGTIVSPDASIAWGGIALPAPAADLSQPCLGVEVPRSLFRAVAPTLTELPWLCHARQVNTEDKELLGQDIDGWFSVVIGNRLPEAGKSYVACLVSLEGAGGLLPADSDVPVFQGGVIDDIPVVDLPILIEDPPVSRRTTTIVDTPPALIAQRLLGARTDVRLDAELGTIIVVARPAVRLACLARWKFTCAGAGDFESIMKALPDRGGVAMFGMAPQDALAPDRVADAAYRLALESGHIPLEHLTRAGERTLAWYRGPLVPAGVDRDPNGPYHSADQARRLDPQTGLENLGYAAAFEIGRLMALADPRFALELLRWRRDGGRRLHRALADARLRDVLPGIFDSLDPRLKLLTRQFASTLVGDIGRELFAERFAPVLDPSGLAGIADRMPGLQAEQIGTALELDRAVVARFLEPQIAGSSGALGDIGIGEPPVTLGTIDALLAGGLAQIEHLNLSRRGIIEGLREEGV